MRVFVSCLMLSALIVALPMSLAQESLDPKNIGSSKENPTQGKKQDSSPTAAHSAETPLSDRFEKDGHPSPLQDRVYRVKVEAGSPDKAQMASVILSICAFFVSVVSLATSIYFSWCARDHNRRSVKPLPFIRQPDYENYIAVIVQNNGTGPLVLRQTQAASTNGTCGHLIDLIPSPPARKYFKSFNKIEQIRAIRPGDQLVLFEIDIDMHSPVETAYRDELRRALGSLTLSLEYTDIYETRFAPYSRTLDWFLRHFR